MSYEEKRSESWVAEVWDEHHKRWNIFHLAVESVQQGDHDTLAALLREPTFEEVSEALAKFGEKGRTYRILRQIEEVSFEPVQEVRFNLNGRVTGTVLAEGFNFGKVTDETPQASDEGNR